MSEIEKMYENAGIEKKCYPKMLKCHHCEHYKVIDEYTGRCLNEVYPPFTAKKQIAILKLLTQQCDLTISHFSKWEFIHYDGQEPLQVSGKDFTETFANLVNAYFQYLTEKEKAEIKRILE